MDDGRALDGPASPAGLQHPGHAETLFLAQRPRLLRLATRTLGAVDEAEDVVQDAWIRWVLHHETVRSAPAWLSAVTRNLALTRVTSTARRHEVAVDAFDSSGLIHCESVNESQQSVDGVRPTITVVLQSLSPLERAVFVLHDVLDWSYGDVARLTARTEAAVRQLAHRARRHLAAAPERCEVSQHEVDAAARSLVSACAGGGVDRLLDVIAPGLARVPGGARRVGNTLVHDVAGLALVRAGRLLLCHRRRDTHWYPDVWDLPGGHVQLGESSAACTTRAVRRSLGISAVSPQTVTTASGDDFVLEVLTTDQWEGSPRLVRGSRHDDLAFVTRDEAARLRLADPRLLDLYGLLDLNASVPPTATASAPGPVRIGEIT